VKSIAQQAKELHAVVMAAPGDAEMVAHQYGEGMNSAVKVGALSASLCDLESRLRYLVEDLTGEKLEAPAEGWPLRMSDGPGLELLAAAEVAPQEDVSIAGVG